MTEADEGRDSKLSISRFRIPPSTKKAQASVKNQANLFLTTTFDEEPIYLAVSLK